MKKAALSGAAMNVIIGLITALIALIILWVFHEKIFNFLSDVIIPGIQRMVCEAVIKPLKYIFGGIGGVIGAVIGTFIAPGVGTLIGGELIGAGTGYGLGSALQSWVC